MGERAAFELRQNQIALGPDDVAKHANDVDLELFNPVALPHGVSGGRHAGLDLVDWVIGRSRRKRHNQHRQARKEGEKKSLHVVESIGKFL